MFTDPDDTIAAIASPLGGAARGIVRISGPGIFACLESCFRANDSALELTSVRAAQSIAGQFIVADPPLEIDCQLLLWPTERSYTRQPTAELHTIGSPPLLEALLQTLCGYGARIAEPGEFTLRAFLAGRLDLTQAEAVLGVIDARSEGDLQTALAQLAGGMSRPLAELRNSLLDLLADLEAGLDFVEEDIEFVDASRLIAQLTEARALIQATLEQLRIRALPEILPRVVLVGAPNAGKSSLFNALASRFATSHEIAAALVSSRSGTTRDYLTAPIQLEGVRCELIDTAGEVASSLEQSIEFAAQEMTSSEKSRATLRLLCLDAADPTPPRQFAGEGRGVKIDGIAITKCDLVGETENRVGSFDGPVVRCSSITGEGLTELSRAIAQLLGQRYFSETGAVAATAARCFESLAKTEQLLSAAIRLAETTAQEELVAAEIRAALEQLGRVIGAVYTDDVLDRIFSKFCIGK